MVVGIHRSFASALHARTQSRLSSAAQSPLLSNHGAARMLFCARNLVQPSATRLAVRHSSSESNSDRPASFFRGVFPIMATPFNADESLDVEGFQKALRFMAEAGADGVTICGVLGESNRMTDNERATLISAAVEVAREVSATPPSSPPLAPCDVPTPPPTPPQSSPSSKGPFRVCVGTSHAGTAATVALSQMAQQLGAAAVMVTPSKEPTPVSADTMVEYYRRVGKGCPGLPIVLQDHPASTQVHMSVDLVARIVAEVENVSCIKLESLPTPARIAALRNLWENSTELGSRGCTILTGLGALYGGFDMEQGTEGFMTGFAFPEILIEMNRAAQAKDFARAHAIYHRFLPLIVFEQQPGVAVRKELYRLRGLIADGHVRHPANPASAALKTALAAQIARSLPNVDVTKPLPPAVFDEL
mmetsp:Transcript_42782/g.93759  ORF Transcript_42782/g.93759 Transcript_42782/m.93759 type:complete len:418 (-) Transcript_42782:496-1749(-)